MYLLVTYIYSPFVSYIIPFAGSFHNILLAVIVHGIQCRFILESIMFLIFVIAHKTEKYNGVDDNLLG